MGSVVELRQYTLHPGQRDVLIDLFERELIAPQEAVGMRIVGQFRDANRPDRFVWLRSFPDMRARREALQAFYGGPVWKAHRDAANATMVDSSNVLLLRPVVDFPDPTPPSGQLIAAIYPLRQPVDRAFLGTVAAATAPLACFETEPAENDFPALPVRAGEDVFVAFWPSEAADLSQYFAASPECLRLLPTARSRLR